LGFSAIKKISKQNQHTCDNHTVIKTRFSIYKQHKTKKKEHRKTLTEQETQTNTNTTSPSMSFANVSVIAQHIFRNSVSQKHKCLEYRREQTPTA